MTSCSSPKTVTAATGPNVSSCIIAASSNASTNNVGSKKRVLSQPVAADEYLAVSAFQRPACSSTLSTARLCIQGPISAVGSEPLPTFSAAMRAAKTL